MSWKVNVPQQPYRIGMNMLCLNKLTSAQGLITMYSILASRKTIQVRFYPEQSQPGFFRSVFLERVGLRRPLAPHPVLLRGVPPAVNEVDCEADGHPHHETHLVHQIIQMIIGLSRRVKQALEGSHNDWCCLCSMDSEIAGPVWVKLAGMVEGMP